MVNVVDIESNLSSINTYIHFFDADRNSDISFVQAGFHNTEGGYSFGPVVRDHFLIHFVLSGRGVLELNNRRYIVKAGECFLIYPHQISYYESSADNPWEYMWLGFCGNRAESLADSAGFSYEKEIRPMVLQQEITQELQKFIDFLDKRCDGVLPEDILYFTSVTYSILYLLTSGLREHKDSGYAPEQHKNEKKRKLSKDSEYVRTIISIVQTSYAENILVEKIAEKLGFNRSNLNSVFKSHTGMSIKDYLTNYRISVSKKLLSDSGNSIQVVALKSGFSDPLYFSKMFKKQTGLSPLSYRNQINSKHSSTQA